MSRHVFALKHSAVRNVAGHARFAVPDDGFTNLAPHAVSAYQGAAFNFFSIGQSHRHRARRLVKGFNPGIGTQGHIRLRPAGLQKYLMQVSAVNYPIRKAVGRTGYIAQGHANHLFTGTYIIHPETCRKKSHAIDHFGETQIVKHAENIGPELNTRADFTEGFRLFQHSNGVTVLCQHHSGSQTANATARNNEGKGLLGLCHT